MISVGTHKKSLFIVLLGCGLVIAVLNAWVCDDAYISFRVIDNLVNGHGLTWNVTERVQVFTHPLWLLVLVLLRIFTGELYFTATILALLLFAVIFYLYYFRAAARPEAALPGLALLIFSKSFMDFSFSGLENPLSHLLLAVFFLVYFKRKSLKNPLFVLGFISSLAALNRMDTILLYLPLLLITLWQQKSIRNLLKLLAGFVPFFLWELFSLFYYGFLFPNTAYAKLGHARPLLTTVRHGLFYFLNSLKTDPITVCAIILILVLVFVQKKKNLVPFALGIMLYLFYVLAIGGDFMSGRFFSLPLLGAVLLLSRLTIKWKLPALTVAAVFILAGLLMPRSPVRASASYNHRDFDAHGISDERGYYYPSTGLLKVAVNRGEIAHEWAQLGRNLKKSTSGFFTQVKIVKNLGIGLLGYYAGPAFHIVPPFAISDAFLARMPVETFWRSGHIRRRIPPGYMASLKSGKNRIADPGLARYYARLQQIVSGPLWNWQRIKTIVRFNLGKYNSLKENFANSVHTKSTAEKH